ncbi:MAG: hypothetical protein NTW97_02465 [Candidatus Krumholzibacteria bacterium]|nr:hypothetical protein [Candidatus Krumholzibacteria bacterium]
MASRTAAIVLVGSLAVVLSAVGFHSEAGAADFLAPEKPSFLYSLTYNSANVAKTGAMRGYRTDIMLSAPWMACGLGYEKLTRLDIEDLKRSDLYAYAAFGGCTKYNEFDFMLMIGGGYRTKEMNSYLEMADTLRLIADSRAIQLPELVIIGLASMDISSSVGQGSRLWAINRVEQSISGDIAYYLNWDVLWGVTFWNFMSVSTNITFELQINDGGDSSGKAAWGFGAAMAW